MSEHAPFSPSAADRWMKCPASYERSKNKIDKGSKYADEGTDAHTLASECAIQDRLPHEFLGERMPLGTEVTCEMADAIHVYLNEVSTLTNGLAYSVERRVRITKDCWGTSDVIYFNPSTGELQVHDLKYGKGIMVDAPNNWQLVIYAIGAYLMYHDISAIKTIRMFIHQPRLGHISDWEITEQELIAKLDIVLKAIAVCETEDAKAYPGEKQCRWCKVKGSCRELAERSVQTVADSFEDLEILQPKNLSRLTLKELSECGKQADLIKLWLDDLRLTITEKVLAGIEIAGFKAVYGRRPAAKWLDKEEAGKILSRRGMLNKVDVYKKTVITPTQAKKLTTKKQYLKLFDVIEIGEPKLTVVASEAKGQEVSVSNVLKEQFED